jgi:hypothetical protein
MKPEVLDKILSELSDEVPYVYFADCESAWVLSQMLGSPARLDELKKQPCGRLLGRPLVGPVVAKCGSGVIDPYDLALVALPQAPEIVGACANLSPAARAGIETARGLERRGYRLTFSSWGSDSVFWDRFQTSRRGVNLVIQVNFEETEEDRQFHREFAPVVRLLGCSGHPIRRDGPITMAWARVDIDLETGEALIEEIQSDWFCSVRAVDIVGGLAMHQLRDSYLVRHARAEWDWPNVTLHAALWLLKTKLGVHRFYFHRRKVGEQLKMMGAWGEPPRSIYEKLPQSFGFQGTTEAPRFLEGERRHTLADARDSGKPIFWRLDLGGDDAASRVDQPPTLYARDRRIKPCSTRPPSPTP